MLPGDILLDPFHRLPRRIAALHTNRYWENIVRTSKENGIPLKDVAVRISCKEFPFQIQVFDWHELLEDAKETPHLAMAAEILHQSEGERRECLLVVLRMQNMAFPCAVHVNNKWMKSVLELPPETENSERACFVDEDGNALVCEQVDALRAGVRLAKKYAVDLGKTVWDSAVLCRATDEVMEEFEQELFEDASDNATNYLVR